MKLQKKLENYHGQFETQDRKGETIVVFGTNATQELKDSVMKAHDERLPNDWVFSTYLAILTSLIDSEVKTIEEAEEVRGEIVDGLVDVYTADLTNWLNSDIRNIDYLSLAIEELGAKEGYQALSGAQYLAIDEICEEVLNLLRA